MLFDGVKRFVNICIEVTFAIFFIAYLLQFVRKQNACYCLQFFYRTFFLFLLNHILTALRIRLWSMTFCDKMFVDWIIVHSSFCFINVLAFIRHFYSDPLKYRLKEHTRSEWTQKLICNKLFMSSRKFRFRLAV